MAPEVSVLLLGGPQPPCARERTLAALEGRPVRVGYLMHAARVQTASHARDLAAAAGYPPEAGERAFAVRRAREWRRLVHRDPLATRHPNFAVARYLSSELAAAYEAARYRRSAHGHQVRFLTDGRPWAAAETRVVHPSEVGPPQGSTKQTVSVLASMHHIGVPCGWVRRVRARGAAIIDGRMVLDLEAEPDPSGAYAAVWIEQGRGMNLRTEHGFVERRYGRWHVCRDGNRSRWHRA